jgi:hypothetical protein
MSARRPNPPVLSSLRGSRSPNDGAARGKRECGPADGQNRGEDTARKTAAGTPRTPTAGGRSYEPQEARGVEHSRAGGNAAYDGESGGGPVGPEGPTGRTTRMAGCPDAAGRALPGRARRGGGHQLRPLGRWRRGRRALPLRRTGHRDPSPADRADPRDLARLRPRRRRGTAVRLPGARPLGPLDRCPVERGQAAPRPVRPRGGRVVHPAARGLRPCTGLARAARRRHRARRPGLRAVRPQGRRRA